MLLRFIRRGLDPSRDEGIPVGALCEPECNGNPGGLCGKEINPKHIEEGNEVLSRYLVEAVYHGFCYMRKDPDESVSGVLLIGSHPLRGIVGDQFPQYPDKIAEPSWIYFRRFYPHRSLPIDYPPFR